MSDAPNDSEPGRWGFGRSFAVAFGLCAVPPLLLFALTSATGTTRDASGLFALFPGMIGLGALAVGVTQMVQGNGAGGGGLILGALAGFVVGFSLCLGTFSLGPMN